MPANFESIEQAVKSLGTTTIVSCPMVPIAIPGIGAGAEGALDAMGIQFTISVPKRGVIISSTYYDLDFESTQVNVHLFNRKVTAIADNDAWTLSDGDAPYLVKTLEFVSYITHSNTVYIFDLTNIGKAYIAPSGKLWVQAQCMVICTIAVAPLFSLQIQSFDPDFKES